MFLSEAKFYYYIGISTTMKNPPQNDNNSLSQGAIDNKEFFIPSLIPCETSLQQK